MSQLLYETLHKDVGDFVADTFDSCADRGACCISDFAEEAFALDNNDPAKVEAMARLAGAALWYANSLRDDAAALERDAASGEEWPEP